MVTDITEQRMLNPNMAFRENSEQTQFRNRKMVAE